jgi:sarcosine oxidase subunit alpha
VSRRLATGGLLLDRERPLGFRFNGRHYKGFAGDTLASALLANGVTLVGRSFKYHRPRGIVASGVEEPNALVGLGSGGRFEPNTRATTEPLTDGLEARSQNHWPSLAFDLGVLAAQAAPLLPAGFYYKTFLRPRAAWKHLFEPAIRHSAGLGAPPTAADPDTYEYAYAHADVVVAGGGAAGLAAALAAGRAGERVLLLEQSPHWGGRALVDGAAIDGLPAADWVAATLAALDALPNVQRRARTMAAGVHDHGYLLAEERPETGPRRRLWRVRARRVVVAAGAIERPLACAGNDKPGVMLASAVRDYLALWGVAPAERTVVVTPGDDGYRTALALAGAGLAVPAILDVRDTAEGALPAEARAAGLRIVTGAAVASITGRRGVEAVLACDAGATGAAIREAIACDAVALAGGRSPAVHLFSHSGGKLAWDAAAAHFAPDPARPPRGPDGEGFVLAAGSAAGALDPAACLASAHAAGARAAAETGHTPSDDSPAPRAEPAPEAPAAAVWMLPARASHRLRAKAFLDFQNDVKVSDVELAAREGYVSVEHAKRYTTLGMATDQGKLSNVPGLAVLAAATGREIPQVGTTTFRPPYAPVTFGALAGEARGALFKPARLTPIDAWHAANGAHWEPVGDWRRPYTYLRPGEEMPAAVTREILNTRQNVGLLDASTLGKLLVKGPDAPRFLDLLYPGVMSSLPVGRCRYGLMCNDNGFLFDDGVVVRLTDDSFLCHTTSGGSDRVHAWMEEWLHTEWPDLEVYTANLTEQFAQVAVVGPRSRTLLEAVGTDIDLSRDALPFMHWREGTLAAVPARIYRISFSGELSYEVAVPASRGRELWDALLAAGANLGVQPYGTEALHVMRAEKGFIMIGDETDGTVTPQDLALGWAVSKKKPDFIGKRAQQRPDLVRPNRKQLVGLLTEDPATVLPDGAHAVAGEIVPHGPTPTIGHVTSTYFSPTLGRSIAMGLVAGGSTRRGETLSFPVEGGRVIRAAVVDPVFLDPENTRQNV